MTSKVSSETVSPQKTIGDNLNYSFDYVYDENYAHRLVNAGERYYKYDANGNIICEQDGSFECGEDDVKYHKINNEADDVYSTDYGWGLFKDKDTSEIHKKSRYRRSYVWDERNQLVSSVDSNYNTAYIYGQDGQRSNKYTQSSETLYFNKMWTLHTDSGNNIYGGQTAKNIYLGETRIVTKLNSGMNPTYQEEYYKQYFYHSDHLGSASLISDYKGDEYQRIEYTPYGETWVEKTQNQGLEFLPYKFTAKELDEETGLYYYGARYLDPKYSMWISTDPALGEYIPKAPIDEEAKRYNQNLPGMGGVFNHINGNLYHYAGNNPVRYVDPDGNSAVASITLKQAAKIAVVRGAPKLALAATDGPSPLLDIVATLWLCYDVYDILKNYSLTATEENEGQNPSGESPANEPSPLPDEGANSEKENTDGLGQVLNGAKPGRETKGHTKQWEKPGNMDDANKDFDSLNPQDVKNIPGGRAGKLPDGRNINVRDHSSDGRPTLEVQNGKERIKVRYGEE